MDLAGERKKEEQKMNEPRRRVLPLLLKLKIKKKKGIFDFPSLPRSPPLC